MSFLSQEKKMAQKVNSNIFRIEKKKKNNWESKYIEKTNEESSLIVFQDLEIRKFIFRFFNLYSLYISRCQINRCDDCIMLKISFIITINSINYLKKIDNKILSRSNNNKVFLSKNFINKFVSTLNVFLNKKYKINIVLQCLNKSLSSRLINKEVIEFRKKIINLRVFYKNNYFKDFINLYLLIIKKKFSSKVLSELIAFYIGQMKKHNGFIHFLKRYLKLIIDFKYSKIKGIKIIIKGRLNGVPRSKSKLLQVGYLPLQTFNATINYDNSTAYTSDGTIGIKVWICEQV